MDKTVWYFINSETQTEKIYVVGLDSARIAASLMNPEEQKKWFVRNIEKKLLRRVYECEELRITETPVANKASAVESPVKTSEAVIVKEKNREPVPISIKVSAVEPPALAPRIVQTVLPPHPNTVSMAVAIAKDTDLTPSTSQRRRNKRVNGKLRVLLFVDKRVYRTHTRDVSVGGLYLENSLPSNLKGQRCRIVIGSTNSQANIEFEADIKDLDEKGTRVIFSSVQKHESLQHLCSWIDLLEGESDNSKALTQKVA